MDNRTVIVSGSHGIFEIRLEDGAIVKKDLLNDEYASITKFNIKEFKDWWVENKPMDKFPFYGIDIVDIGYWFQQMNLEVYEPPEEKHRKFIYGLISEEEYFSESKKKLYRNIPTDKLVFDPLKTDEVSESAHEVIFESINDEFASDMDQAKGIKSLVEWYVNEESIYVKNIIDNVMCDLTGWSMATFINNCYDDK